MTHVILDGILNYLKENGIEDICKQRTPSEADIITDGPKWYLHMEFANIFLDGDKINLEVNASGGKCRSLDCYDFDLADPEIFDKILKILLDAKE